MSVHNVRFVTFCCPPLYTRFEPYSQPRHGFLTVLEEIPGLVHHEDLTEILVVSHVAVIVLWSHNLIF